MVRDRAGFRGLIVFGAIAVAGMGPITAKSATSLMRTSSCPVSSHLNLPLANGLQSVADGVFRERAVG